MKMLALTAFAALLGLAPAALAQSAQPAPPTCDVSEHRALDFWIGEWDVYVTGGDTLAGRSSIRGEEAGCVITEQWRSEGSPLTGRSLNVYDRETRRWEQFWVSSAGGLTHFIGAPIENGMVLTAPEARIWFAPGAVFQSRITLTRQPDGSVRQHGETSPDGQTWTTRYDYTYRRRPA
jgi:hypothetical protein